MLTSTLLHKLKDAIKKKKKSSPTLNEMLALDKATVGMHSVDQNLAGEQDKHCAEGGDAVSIQITLVIAALLQTMCAFIYSNLSLTVHLHVEPCKGVF